MNNNVKNPLSIDFDDDNEDYNKLKDFIINHTENQKSYLISELLSKYDDLTAEVEERKKISDRKKKPYVRYILRHSKEYKKNQLMCFELSDVINIYNELKLNKTNKIKEIIKFFK